jgi:hypothetical protein
MAVTTFLAPSPVVGEDWGEGPGDRGESSDTLKRKTLSLTLPNDGGENQTSHSFHHQRNALANANTHCA